MVTLENTPDRAFVFGTKNINEVESTDDIDLFRTKKVAVKSGRGTLISFLITPQKVVVTKRGHIFGCALGQRMYHT